MVVFNPFSPGTKKYSPPFGMTKASIGVDCSGLRGSSPIMDLGAGGWPIIGSDLSRCSLLYEIN